MIQKALDAKGIRYVRIDGSLSPSKRDANLKLFREDDAVKVILMTISCGGVG